MFRQPFFKIILMVIILMMVTIKPLYAQAPEGQEYTVQPGEWLSQIAEQFLGGRDRYADIVEATNAKAANDDSFTPITDPNVIEVGQKLWIPVAETAAAAFAGIYTASLPAADTPGRDMTLTLDANGAAARTIDYLNGKAPIEENGAWQDNGDGTATVTLTGRPGLESPDVITYRLTGDTLTAIDYDLEVYGAEGLSLQKQTEAVSTADTTEDVVGIYKTMLPGASSPGLDSTLYVNAGRSARLVSDYLNDEPPIDETGYWEIVDEQVVVTLTGQVDRAYDTPVVTTYEVDAGALVEVEVQAIPGAYVPRYLPFDALAAGREPVPYDAAAAQEEISESGYAGTYKGFLPAATCCGRDITLTLSPDGPAFIATNFLNGDPPIKDVGTWVEAGDGRIDITWDGADSPLMLALINGVLRTTAADDVYGDDGLTLYYYPTIALNSNLPIVTGTVTYRERIALPPETLITVQLVDVSLADAPAQIVSEQMITAGGQQPPFAFELPYSPRTFNPTRTYAVQARIAINGQLRFINDTQYRVLTDGAPNTVELVLVSTGRATAASADNCVAVTLATSPETPPGRSKYLAYSDDSPLDSAIVGAILSVDSQGGDTTAQWRDAVLPKLGLCTADFAPDQVTVYNISASQATVVTVAEILFDDSVVAQEVRLDLELVEQPDVWQVKWGGVRFRCARGDNTTEWQPELCP
ncbi:MAG: YbaY family lipoprotein [Anaerolineaceae bacterium]|nr:YbaY family lipoprotein [Anaerolineaceae bacterium]MCB9100657.1 YbaY family lipoprotein [Anaerolineales bacterium]